MNLFLLALKIAESAEATCDAHCVKMILESTQLLYSAHHVNSGKLPKVKSSELPPYKLNHRNHPTAIWVRTSKNNYDYLLSYAFALAEEYTARYGKTHKCVHHLKRLQEWGYPEKTVEEEPPAKKRKVKKKPTVYATKSIPQGCTPFPLCLPEEYMVHDAAGNYFGVESYRKYYKAKPKMMKKPMVWSKIPEHKPKWFDVADQPA